MKWVLLSEACELRTGWKFAVVSVDGRVFHGYKPLVFCAYQGDSFPDHLQIDLGDWDSTFDL